MGDNWADWAQLAYTMAQIALPFLIGLLLAKWLG